MSQMTIMLRLCDRFVTFALEAVAKSLKALNHEGHEGH